MMLYRLDTAQSAGLIVLATAAALALAVLFLRRALYPTYDPREPLALWPKIPFVGHAYSIIVEGGPYYERL